MASYALYYEYEEGIREFLDTYTEKQDAYAEKHRLEAQIADDEDAYRVRVIVVEEL